MLLAILVGWLPRLQGLKLIVSQTNGFRENRPLGLFVSLPNYMKTLRFLLQFRQMRDLFRHGDSAQEMRERHLNARKSARSGLFHEGAVSVRLCSQSTVEKSVKNKIRRTSSNTFPATYVTPLLETGFCENWTARLLTTFMMVGGIREKEGLNAWVSDIQNVKGEAAFFLHHPTESVVTDSEGSLVSRRQFLERHCGITPRGMGDDAGRSWKRDVHGVLVHWLPIPGIGEALATAVRAYIDNVRTPAVRARRGRGLPDHPFLLVSPETVFGRGAGSVGNPYTKFEFWAAWNSALDRLKRRNGPSPEMDNLVRMTPYSCRLFYAAGLFAQPGSRRIDETLKEAFALPWRPGTFGANSEEGIQCDAGKP